MANYPVHRELKPMEIALDKIFLDPNNPRFAAISSVSVPKSQISNALIQQEVQKKLEDGFAIDKLVMNMEANGFLPIDRVVVQEFEADKYVVLEGNRRICAAKKIAHMSAKNPKSINEDVAQSVSIIPCLLYVGSDSQASWVFQGLRHIIGVHEWPAFNKAKLLASSIENEGLTLTEVGKKFGLTAFGAGQWVRAYFAFKYASESSDYTSEIDERCFPYLQELFSKSNGPLRDWLEWNESDHQFTNQLNFNEFLGWLYPRDFDNEDESIDPSSIKGDWGKRKISRSLDVRLLSYLIRNDKAQFEQFRSDGDLEKAYSKALQKKYEQESRKDINPTNEVFNTLEACLFSLSNVPFKMLVDQQTRTKLFGLLSRLEDLIREIKEAALNEK
ncbi:MAG: ParB/Srx family N-terminal domain-containing protein [Thermoplasmatales archaeon]